MTITAPAALRRQTFDVELRPVLGSRFQPTGFPDIGAATFKRPIQQPDGSVILRDDLLVESAQSMANHLESVGWDRARQDQVPEFAGLPYVRVVTAEGEYLTSSRTEAHRLAAAFVKDSMLDGTGMREVIRERLGLREDRPLAPRQIAAAVLALDPLCLVHGVFFAESAKVWPGQPRIARVTTAMIEAQGVQQVVSGGVKRDDVRHTVSDGGGAAEGYGFVPFHRTEFAAARVLAGFSIDRAQIASYGLPESATAMLLTLAQWEIRALLDRGLRLRTACDLELAGDVPLPSYEELTEQLRAGIDASADLLGERGPLEVVWQGSKKRAVKGSDA
ncbi:MAG: type I-U CRISPR-associated RAMP protein Csb1/Cas7u [Actinomycetota bacterium]|nr:type I-U CRISPR-associated RAMP protein Csb1/Cas7u [Actinomycetota bacterium]